MKKCPFYRGECDADACTLWKQCGSSFDRVEEPCMFVVWLRYRMSESGTRVLATEG